MAPRKPDFGVYGKSLDGTHWKQCGVAWINKKGDTKYVRVALDFMPTTGQLTIWPYDEDAVDEIAVDDIPF